MSTQVGYHNFLSDEEDPRVTRARARKVMARRCVGVLDLGSDVAVLLDNATRSQVMICGLEVMDDQDHQTWAHIGFAIIILPFIVEYLLLRQLGSTTLQRRGLPCAKAFYMLLGLPFIVLVKAWILLFHPWRDAGFTSLSFLGALDQMQIMTDAFVRAPLHGLFSCYIMIRKAQLDGGRPSPLLLLSFVTSVLAQTLGASFVAARRDVENRWLDDKDQELSFTSATNVFFTDPGSLETFSARELNLSDPRAIGEIAWALREPTLIVRLELTDCYIKEIGLIADALKSNKTLQELVFARNRIKDLSALAEALEENSSVSLLSLEGNRVEDIDALSSALAVNLELKELCLADNRIQELGHLAAALQLNTTLLELSLAGNAIQDIAPIAVAVSKNKTLRALYLNRNPIEEFEPLIQALKGNSTLETLYLTCEDMAGWSAFETEVDESAMIA